MKDIIKELGLTAILGAVVVLAIVFTLRPLAELPEPAPTAQATATVTAGGDVHVWDMDGNPVDDPFALREEQNVLLVIMYYMRPDCGHCKTHIEDLNRYHDYGFVEVVGFMPQDNRVPQAIEEWGIDFPVYYTDQPATATPVTVAIAWNGEEQEWKKVIERVGVWTDDVKNQLEEWTGEANRIFMENEE